MQEPMVTMGRQTYERLLLRGARQTALLREMGSRLKIMEEGYGLAIKALEQWQVDHDFERLANTLAEEP
jgi:hypothetical protein